MGVFKDDRIVAKVLGNQTLPSNNHRTLKRLALLGGALAVLALAAFAVTHNHGAALALTKSEAPASAAPAQKAEDPVAVFSAAPSTQKKRLPPVIEEATVESIELPMRDNFAALQKTAHADNPAVIAEPAAKKSAPPSKSTTTNALLDDAKRIEDGANGDPAQLEKARALYQQALESNKLQNPYDTQCLVRLNDLTAQLILDPKARCAEPKAVFYKVAQGDVVEKIARKYKVNQGQIKRVNHLNDRLNVRLGQTLKLLPGEVLYKVNRERLTGTLYIDGVFIRRYPVGIGPGDSTPKGAFTVENKVANPDWYYEGKKFAFGDPKNILGSRWMGMAGTYGNNGAGLGVHGTCVPDSVPGRESKGCVRMRNEDVEELYDFMPQGGKVVIE